MLGEMRREVGTRASGRTSPTPRPRTTTLFPLPIRTERRAEELAADGGEGHGPVLNGTIPLGFDTEEEEEAPEEAAGDDE